MTSLGLSAPSSIVAIRSIIANFTEHETVLVNEDAYGTELSGARIARLSEHIVSRHVCGAERAAALLAPAIRECIRRLPEDMRTGVDWKIRNWIEPWDIGFETNLKGKLPDLPFPVAHHNDASALALERCLFFDDIIQAVSELLNGARRMAIVACVDSLCETLVLDRLCEMGRLKSGTHPAGIVAGEAAGVVLLELESHARRRGAPIHAYISAWGGGFEPNPWRGSMPSSARGMSSAFREAFAQLLCKGEEIEMLVVDLNGERERACEWGIVAGRIFPKDDKERELRHPADCVGDCGAAMGPVLIATAVGLMSGGAGPHNIAVSTADEYGSRRVLCIEKGDESDKGAVVRVEVGRGLSILPAVIEQHVDEASSLWMVRNHLMSAPHCGLSELAWHDDRVEAHLHGLRLAGNPGWELCRKAFDVNYTEDMFAPAVLAFESGNDERVNDVLAALKHDREKVSALISALGWLTYERAKPHINTFLSTDSAFYRYIGIAASAIHRRDPGVCLDAAIDDDNLELKARALKAVGEVGGRERKLIAKVREYLNSDNEEVRFSAAWSAALIYDEEAIEALQSFAVPTSRYWEPALNLVLRRMEPADALAWLKKLSSESAAIRLAIVGAGIVGDPVLVPWLIEQMKAPTLGRVAGEAFTIITGVDIELERMKGFRPEGFGSGPNDNTDDYTVAVDADENLPWPDPELIWKWWNLNAGQFQSGARHLLGRTISVEHLRNVLRTGRQRQRTVAALELAILEPGRPLFEVRAPGFRQLKELSCQD